MPGLRSSRPAPPLLPTTRTLPAHASSCRRFAASGATLPPASRSTPISLPDLRTPSSGSQRETPRFAKEDQKARRDALARVHHLLSRVEPLVARPDLTLKAAERTLRDLRAALGQMPPLPSKQDYDEAMRRLKAAQSALMPKVVELREVADWQRWANVGIQEQLCEKMEALAAVEDVEQVATTIRDLQQQWRQASDVPRAQGAALWQRFKSAHDAAWTRCEAHFAAQAAVRADNLAKKIALCERAEALADSTSWISTADELKKLQAEWKTIGQVSRGQEKAIWDRFRTALRSLLHAPSGRPCRAEDRLGRKSRAQGSAMREGGGARRVDRLGACGKRDPQAPE